MPRAVPQPRTMVLGQRRTSRWQPRFCSREDQRWMHDHQRARNNYTDAATPGCCSPPGVASNTCAGPWGITNGHLGEPGHPDDYDPTTSTVSASSGRGRMTVDRPDDPGAPLHIPIFVRRRASGPGRAGAAPLAVRRDSQFPDSFIPIAEALADKSVKLDAGPLRAWTGAIGRVRDFLRSTLGELRLDPSRGVPIASVPGIGGIRHDSRGNPEDQGQPCGDHDP
jgi:hypothetical protein